MSPTSLTSARTPLHGLPYLFPGQAQKEAFVNEGFARLDALVQPVVLDERAMPPVDPAAGDCYLVAEIGEGLWEGHGRSLAVWADQWLFLLPREGAQIYDLAIAAARRFADDGGWRRVAAPGVATGGAVQDLEARDTIATVIAKLRAAGIFSV